MGIIYLAALILGLGTIGVQFILSHAGADADHGVDGGEHAGADHGSGAGHDHESPSLSGTLALFLSMRFWTFAFLAFGLVGSALHYLQLCSGWLGAVLATGSGVGAGLLAAAVFRMLMTGVTSAETGADAVGRVGRVLVGMGAGRTGKVRVEIKGKVVDLLAQSDTEVEEGHSVLVLGMRGALAQVEPAPEGSAEGDQSEVVAEKDDDESSRGIEHGA